jgi:hypothetical protein
MIIIIHEKSLRSSSDESSGVASACDRWHRPVVTKTVVDLGI